MLGEIDVAERLYKSQAFLERVNALQKSLDCKILYPAGEKKSLPRIEKIERLVPPLEERVARLLKEHGRIATVLDGLEKEERELQGIRNLPAAAFNPDMLSFVVTRVGWLPEKSLDILKREAKEFAVIVSVEEKDKKNLVVAIVPRKKRFVLQTLLEKLNFAPQQAPAGLSEDPVTALNNIRNAAAAAKLELEQYSRDLARMGEEVCPELAGCRETLEIEISLLRAMGQFGRTSFTCVASGWVPTTRLPELTTRLEKATDGRAFIDAKPVKLAEGRRLEVPVALATHPLFRPFKLLVINFGLPAYGEIDPTPLVAISFTLLFGLMFGDVGQGAVLAAGGVLLRLFGRKEGVRDFGFIFAAAGVSAMFFGLLLYGSFFGVEGFIRISPILLQPLHSGPTGRLDLSGMLIGAVALGVIQLSTGILINILNRFTTKQYFKGVMDKFGIVGLVLYWGAIGLGVLAYFRGVVSGWLIVILIVIPLILIMLSAPLKVLLARRARRARRTAEKEHEEEGVGLSLMEGMVELIETLIAFLANTASFVRVAAFSLAHAGLSLAMWTMAERLSDIPAMPVVIVVVGNLVTIALEGLVAGIQGIRLIYYEFFGKFFGGDGVAFKPFKLKAL
jgi:V/A-type H+-transporting ATPase subunit I